MPLDSFSITREPLSLQRVIDRVAATRFGAVSSFVGTVREESGGRSVRYLEYEAYEPLALSMLHRIGQEIKERWPDAVVAIHHRIGRLTLGEPSVAIVAAAGHRQDAFAACRYAIERVKQIVPIWKREFFDDGESWVEGASADPEDEAARERAVRIACA